MNAIQYSAVYGGLGKGISNAIFVTCI